MVENNLISDNGLILIDDVRNPQSMKQNDDEYGKAKYSIPYLQDNGFEIIIYTSRYMGRFNSDIKKVYDHGFDFTKKQIENWGVKYHKLLLGKPSYDIIIDDKSYNYNKEWIKKIN